MDNDFKRGRQLSRAQYRPGEMVRSKPDSTLLTRSQSKPRTAPAKAINKKTFKVPDITMPKKFRLIALGVFLLIICVQLLWPGSRARPFTKLAGANVGVASKDQIEKKLANINEQSKFQLKLEEKIVKAKWADSGIEILEKPSSQAATSYPVWQRVIPLSVFGNLINQPDAKTRIDEKNLKELARQWADKAYKAPHNAGVNINGLKAELDPAKDGYRFDQAKLTKMMSQQVPDQQTTNLSFKSITVEPVRKDDMIKATIKKAQKAIDTPIEVSFNNKKVKAESQTIASWLAFTESQDKKQLNIDVNQEVLKAYLMPLEKEVYKEPGITEITMVDGAETARKKGENGRGLDQGKTIETIKTVLNEQKTNQVSLSIADLAPKEKINHSFTKTSKGLTALLNKIAKEKGDFAITVDEQGGLNRRGAANGGKQYHPASTYKLLVAYSVLKRIDSKEMKWEDPSPVEGKNVQQCFDVMIIRSDNACAEGFGKALKWGVVSSEARALGLSSTSLNGNFVSTTDDQVTFLNKLLSGKIVSDESRDKLLSTMRAQIYRQGVPAGGSGTVADKVGFLNGLLHDSAIVYGKKGTYTISVYSNGSSWAQIADATRQIEAYFAQ